MHNRSTASIFWLLLLSILPKINIPVVGTHQSQFSNLANSAQLPTLLARVIHDPDDNSAPKEEKT